MENHKHVLPNGCTFLAMSGGGFGHWAKATDPITAMRDVRQAERQRRFPKTPVFVMYGDDESLNASDFGGYTFSSDKPPTPIGMFTVTDRSIKPIKKGEFNETHLDNDGWMSAQLEDIQEQVTIWENEEANKK